MELHLVKAKQKKPEHKMLCSGMELVVRIELTTCSLRMKNAMYLHVAACARKPLHINGCGELSCLHIAAYSRIFLQSCCIQNK